MAARLFLRTAIHARTLTSSMGRVCVTRPVMNKMTPSLSSRLSNRSFTVALPRFSNGEVDSELAHQLEEEMQFEETDEKNEIPPFVQEFLDTNLFKIEDQLGHDKVILTRNFGTEKIRVIFSISDINNTVEEFEDDEEEEAPVKHHEGGLKEGAEEEEKKEEEEEEEEGSFPVRATVMVEKEGKGSLVLNTVAQDGYLHIDAVRYFKEGQIATDEIATKEIGEQRQDLYMGPVYEELGEDLQTTFVKYLEERGIDTALATFLPDYVDYKEQKEYVNWLKDVNDFVSA
ncbi:hypothetical protein INT47_005947 [Mucor saturninus]|uniref:Mitochondrial glyco protein n=1 Tax=Mucor saturninus TaxID=64648 RepID=A0A8H7R854_9FUNG|nr:hypothetical protein INT47_005947 [Mucor saturninus]